MILKLCFVFGVCICEIRCQTTYNSSSMTVDLCLESYNLTSYKDLRFFIKFGRFPRDKELNLKCIWECFAEAGHIVDSNFNPVKEKLKAVAANSTNEYVKFLGSQMVLKNCLQLRSTSSHCDKAYDFMKCYSDVKNEYDQNSGFPCWVFLFVGVLFASLCLVPIYCYIECMQR